MITLATDLNGELLLPIRWIDGIEAYVQRLRHRFQFFRGEWFLDQRKGAPWFDNLLGDFDPYFRLARSLVTDIVLNTPETEAVLGMDLSFNGVDRSLRVANLHVVWGAVVLEFQSEEFIINLGDL